LNVGATGFGNVTFNLTERTGDDFLAYFRNTALTNVWYVSDTGFTWSNSGASFTTVEIRGGADIAEPFDIGGGEAIAPGLVVAIDPERPGGLRLATSEYDRRVAGVVSGAGGVDPGLTLRQEGTEADGTRPVALTGRVYTWVDADANGPVEPGDLLTTSGVAGHAMKATDPERRSGAVLGKAMTGLASGRGLVLALVTLQ
ncbi:MAG: hypothetical protein PVH96_13565, partial [Gemmatimonadota bacterium]